MGLCKCPRKKVTNLFCFEHRVNVCEHCIVENHTKCVVQSYLAWLQDSDYDPNCSLCRRPLADDQSEAVRLLCLHVFHWHCLDSWARQYPAHTAPAGYTCPTCRECIFPKANQESPLVNALKHMLGRANWARAGLGLPLIPEADVGRQVSGAVNGLPLNQNNIGSAEDHYRASSPSTIVPMIGDEHYSTTARKAFPSSAYGDEHEHLLHTSAGGGGSRFAESDHRRPAADTDNEENKYKRRSAFEWFRRWLSSNSVPAPKRRMTNVGGYWTWKRILFYTFLLVVAVLTLVTVLGRMARSSAEGDPFLDPMANPNIRVADVPENS